MWFGSGGSGGRALQVQFEAPAGFADIFRTAFLFASPNVFYCRA